MLNRFDLVEVNNKKAVILIPSETWNNVIYEDGSQAIVKADDLKLLKSFEEIVD